MSRLQVDRSGIDRLIAELESRGYDVLGPVVAGPAVTYRSIATITDLPCGVGSAQSAGHYRLTKRSDDRCFAYGPGVESLKRYLCPPLETLWVATRQNGTLHLEPTQTSSTRPIAVIGVRPCELAAIERLDDVFRRGAVADPFYEARRVAMFLVVANCTEPGDTCFCSSMRTGPAASAGFDLAITELPGGRFVVEIGSDAGGDVMDRVTSTPATPAAIDEERALLARAATHMGRDIATDDLPRALAAAAGRPEWDAIARSCLACANCTMACPTCFCHTIDDRTSLGGDRVERERRWDSCFGADFSYIHGGSVRSSVSARYRQFVMHKFSAWVEQFGTFGCVGCGRCITWCPAALDVTETLRRVTTAAAPQG